MKRTHVVLTLVASLLLIGSGFALVHAGSHTHTPKMASSKNKVVVKTLTNPSTTKVTSNSSMGPVAANEPSSISLPSIGAKGYIQKVGIDQYKQMAAPTNVNLAGWYVNSLLPGQAGLSIIDGHVDGYRHNEGIFGNLTKLKVGDTFTVTFGNGSNKSFEVKSTQLVTSATVPSVLFAHDPTITNQLNLITCGGDYDGVSHTYDKRTIIVSALIM